MEHIEQHSLIIDQYELLMKELKLPLIPLCSHDHENMTQNHINVCNNPGKTPLISGWNSRGKRGADLISFKDMKRMFLSTPEINLGMVLGQTQHYNLVGVDIDGYTGMIEWESLCQKYGETPPTWEFTTGGGGYRLLFNAPMDIITKKHKIHLDGKHQEVAFICQGQQTVIPPSIHQSGENYTWIDGKSPMDIAIAELPTWILTRVTDPRAVPKTESANSKNEPLIIKSKPVKSGNRNNQMTKQVMSICAKLYHTGRDACLAASIAMGTDISKFNPILTEEEIIASFNGAWTKIELQKQQAFEKEQQDKQLSDVSLAREFYFTEAEEGRYYRYRNDMNVFMVTTIENSPWFKVADKQVMDSIYRFLVNKYGEKLATSARVSRMTEILKSALISDPEIGHSEFSEALGNNDNPFSKAYYQCKTIAVSNGVFDLESKTLEAWNPHKHYHTMGLDIVMDNTIDCSQGVKDWEAVLTEWVPDVESRMYLQEYIGYCLTPDCSFTQLTFLLGRGSNGKSLFIELVSQLFGRHVGNFSLSDLQDKFYGSKILDKYLLIDPDMNADYIKNTGTLKTLVAGEAVNIEIKYGTPFQYKPMSKFLFGANTMPKMGDTSYGLSRRINIIKFPNEFPLDTRFKVNLFNKFKNEWGKNVLFNWALEGLIRLQSNNKFTKGSVQETNNVDYAESNDHLQGFLSECLEKVPEVEQLNRKKKSDYSVPREEVYQTYAIWCEDSGEKPRPVRTFTKELIERGYIIERVNFISGSLKKTKHAVVGYRLNDDISENLHQSNGLRQGV